MKIPLTNSNRVAIIDDEDGELSLEPQTGLKRKLKDLKWRLTEGGYAASTVYIPPEGSTPGFPFVVYMHRFVMGFPDGREVHHGRGGKSDNRKSNLTIREPKHGSNTHAVVRQWFKTQLVRQFKRTGICPICGAKKTPLGGQEKRSVPQNRGGVSDAKRSRVGTCGVL